ncbi:MAG: hypothetical protein WBI18_09595 [Candidatus Saccharicenans sp.]
MKFSNRWNIQKKYVNQIKEERKDQQRAGELLLDENGHEGGQEEVQRDDGMTLRRMVGKGDILQVKFLLRSCDAVFSQVK